MKSTCVRHPEDEPLIIIHKWQLEFCEGDRIAAALLSFFEYWHNIKVDMSRKNRAANDTREMHGDNRDQDETLWQFHTEEDIEQGVLIFKRRAINDSLQILVTKGAIDIGRNPNQRYKFDRTRFFLFHPNVVNAFVDAYRSSKNADTSRKNAGQSRRNAARQGEIAALSSENAVTIPEITTETTTETTTKNSGGIGESISKPAQPTPPPLVLPEELPEPAVKLPKILSARTDPLADARSKALQALAKACPVFDAPMGFVTRLNADQCNLLIDWCAKAACNHAWAMSKGNKLSGLLRSMVERGESAEITAKDIDRLWELIEIDRHFEQAQAAAAVEEKPPAPVGPSVNLDPPDEHQTQWTTLLSELERSMQPEAFREFLLDSYPVRVDGNSWLIGVPSSKSMQWLQNRMLPKLQRSLSGMVGQRVEVAFCLQ